MMVSDIDMIYTAHRALLERVERADNPAELVGDTEVLIDQVRRAGANITAADARDYLQSLLTFWGNWVYKQTRVYPNVDLYPPAPELSAQSAPENKPGVVRPRPYQPFAAESSGTARGSGQPFIMAAISSPPDGTTIRVGGSVPLTGLYANLRPSYLLCFVSLDSVGRLTVLDAGYSPVERPSSGTWQAETPFTPIEPGVYRLGIALAVTPEAGAILREAFAARRLLDSIPSGAIPLLDQIAITAQA